MKLLGTPDYDQTGMTKKPPRKFIVRTLRYYFKQQDINLARNNDKCVDIALDKDNRVIRIRSNVDGIPSRGQLSNAPAP